ncbi:penicillin-binding protein 2 [Candidatus Gracilibacteria bacterium]|nr:penicillin-binding protein 2 [Candidatus Gracilibacteria bacterium]
MSNRWRIFDKHFEQSIHLDGESNNPDQWQHVFSDPKDKMLAESSAGFETSFRILRWLVVAIVLALLLRLSYLQLHIGNDLFARGEENYLRVYVTRALRGIIYDRNNIQLVENIPHDNAAIIPADLPRNDVDRQALFAKLSEILDVPAQEISDISEKYRFLYKPIVIKNNIDHDTKLKLISTFTDHNTGILVLDDFSRNYLPSSQGLVHAIGYLGKITDTDWQNARDTYTIDSTVGKVGIEKSYEQYLRGVNGTQKIVVNARNTKVDTLFTSAPQHGCDLITTIDSKLENISNIFLQETIKKYGASGGSVVVMNPNNGQVLALVSQPDFDNNLFAGGVRGKEVQEYEKLLEDKNTPFLNRAISGTYPPGSTFKIVTASSVLEAGIVSPTDKIDSPGQIRITSQFDDQVGFFYKDWKADGHGLLSIVDALAVSSNTFFYQVAGGFESRVGLGVERLSQTAKQFGLGTPLGIDIPGEQAGMVPTPEWKTEKIGASWFTGDTYNYAIGQGYLLATPLQVAGFTSVMANNGKLYQPYLVKEIKNCPESSQREPQVIQESFLKQSTIDVVKQGMYESIYGDIATAKTLRSLPFTMAGKTGTAQFNNNQNAHGWFTAFAPYENPEIVVTVMIEGRIEGSGIAVQTAKQILQWWHENK